MPSPVPGHAAPPFSSFPVSGLQPTIPSAAPPFSLGAGTALHPTTAFPGDYGIPSVSERPKKVGFLSLIFSNKSTIVLQLYVLNLCSGFRA